MGWFCASAIASPAASRSTSARSVGARTPLRPASARASRSRSATRRLIRRDERSAEAAMSRCSPSSSSLSISRLASTLVSGVRSSCEASATNSRWRLSAACVSPRAGQGAEHLVEGAREVRHLVVGLGLGQGHVGVARARDLLGGGGEPAIGRIARRATARPASRARAVPPSTPRRGTGSAGRGWRQALRAAWRTGRRPRAPRQRRERSAG